MSMHVAVIGGGLAGLVAARELRSSDIAVTLIERHFPFGGRLRPVAMDVPDIGRVTFDPFVSALGPTEYPADAPNAPLGFPARSLRRDLYPDLTSEKLLRLPVRHLAPIGGALPAPHIIMPTGGARALIGRLLPRGCDEHFLLRANTEVTALTPAGRGWNVSMREADGTVRSLKADAVLLTQPVPEVLDLLASSRVTITEVAREELARLTYDPALACFTAFAPPTQTLRECAIFSDSPLALMLDNVATGASARGPAVTASVAREWAAKYFGDADEAILRRLLPLIASWVGAEPVWSAVYRQAHAVPRTRVRMPFTEALDVPPLLVAGEAFADYVSHPLDAAYTSTIHAVAKLRRSLSREARIAVRPTPRTPAPVVVEATVSSADEAATAVRAGAGRLILCAAPEVGGLTPTVDTLKLVRNSFNKHTSSVPVTVLIRSRLGDCTYTRGEQVQMQRDARRLLKAGADGIAFGAVRAIGGELRVDRAACELVVALAREFGREVAFHRAFDELGDRLLGLQELIALGFDRVYTTGGRRLAIDGVDELTVAVGYAGWDIEVVPAGVSAGVVGYITAETGCRQVLVESRIADRSLVGVPSPFTRRDHTPLDARAVVEAVRATRPRDARHESITPLV